MIGMTIAVVTTLLTHVPFDNIASTPGVPAHETSTIDFIALGEILAAIAIGAVIGIVMARRIAMTAMPSLVPAFHRLAGLASVAVDAKSGVWGQLMAIGVDLGGGPRI